MRHRPKHAASPKKPGQLQVITTVIRPSDMRRDQENHPELVIGTPIDLPEIVLVAQEFGEPVPAELGEQGDSHNVKVIYCGSRTGAWISRKRIVGTVDRREYAHSRALKIYNEFPAAVRAQRRVKVVAR